MEHRFIIAHPSFLVATSHCDLVEVSGEGGKIMRGQLHCLVRQSKHVIFFHEFPGSARVAKRRLSGARSYVIYEPIACKFGDFFQRARLFKEVRRLGNNFQFHLAAHPIACHLV